MPSYNIAEKFVSINGEGRRAGQLAVFIRFFGCNLRCSYCDTAWAWPDNIPTNGPGEQLSNDEIYQFIKQSKVRNVTLTGGEPLRQPHILTLLEQLAADKDLFVEIETNGSQPLGPVLALANRPALTVDYKLPGSGMEEKMRQQELTLLDKQDVVKFVCGSPADLQRAEQIIRQLRLIDKVGVYLSPVWGQIEPAAMVEFMRQKQLNGVNLQLQLHKFIWPPEARGV